MTVAGSSNQIDVFTNFSYRAFSLSFWTSHTLSEHPRSSLGPSVSLKRSWFCKLKQQCVIFGAFLWAACHNKVTWICFSSSPLTDHTLSVSLMSCVKESIQDWVAVHWVWGGAYFWAGGCKKIVTWNEETRKIYSMKIFHDSFLKEYLTLWFCKGVEILFKPPNRRFKDRTRGGMDLQLVFQLWNKLFFL